MCVQWNTQVGVNDGQVLRERQTVVTTERPTQTSLPSVSRNGATASGKEKQRAQAKCSGLVVKSLVVDVHDGQPGTVVDDLVQVSNTEEHGDGVRQCSDKANGHGTQNGNRNDAVSTVDFFSQVRGRIKTRETPVRVDQTNNEGDSSRVPAGVVLEVCEDKRRSVVVSTRTHQHRDGDHHVGEQRDVQCGVGDIRQVFTKAVEQDQEKVDQLVCDEEFPRFGDVIWVGQVPETHEHLSNTESHGCTCKKRTSPGQRSTQVSQETGVFSRRQHSGPYVLASSTRNGTGKFRQGNTNEVRDTCNDDDTINDHQRTSRLDACDQRCRNTEP